MGGIGNHRDPIHHGSPPARANRSSAASRKEAGEEAGEEGGEEGGEKGGEEGGEEGGEKGGEKEVGQ